MSKFMNGLTAANSFGRTENGAIKRTTSGRDLYDMFALGAAYRSRSEADCVLLFKNAYKEDPAYALKCLFYIGDVREGQGERRFFRVCYRWLIANDEDAARRNLQYIPEFKRWDDLIKVCYNTRLWPEAVAIVRTQLAADVESLMRGPKEAVSLLAKWMPSENASSRETCALANALRSALGWTHKQYRTILSRLRERSNVLERLMSAGKWDEIEFDAIPSKAGIKYKNAFARHDIERMKSEKAVQSYEDFAKDKNTTVNAGTLYPYEVVDKAIKTMYRGYYNRNVALDDTDRLMVNKYWDNLTDYFKDASLDALAVVDTSCSMRADRASSPINVAISLGMYCAERAKGPYAGHYVSFSRTPKLVKVQGADFCDKVKRIYDANLCENTNIEATFDMLLDVAMRNGCTQEDLPKNIIVISDMEFDQARGYYRWDNKPGTSTLMENIEKKWNHYGYKMPKLIFWNVDARSDNFAMEVKDGISFVSGCSPVIFKQVMTGKTAYDLMYEVLDAKRYEVIK